MDISTEFRELPAEENGAWFEYGDGRLLVASVNSRRYASALERAFSAHRRQTLSNRLPQETRDACVRQAAAEALLLGWENVTEDGKALQYSAKEAARLLESYPRLLRIVQAFSTDVAAFEEQSQAERVEELKKG